MIDFQSPAIAERPNRWPCYSPSPGGEGRGEGELNRSSGRPPALIGMGSATVWHGDRTWVTRKGQDIGYTFGVTFGVFCGHAVENNLLAQSASASDRSGVGASSNHSNTL